jgi:hypothetical protein
MQAKLTRLYAQLCPELGIPRAKIEIRRRCYRFGWKDAAGLYRVRRKTIIIYVDSCRRGKLDPRVLAHETLHHFQHCMGWYGNDVRSWKGRPQSDFINLEYSDRPWEAQAELFEEFNSLREGWHENISI